MFYANVILKVETQYIYLSQSLPKLFLNWASLEGMPRWSTHTGVWDNSLILPYYSEYVYVLYIHKNSRWIKFKIWKVVLFIALKI